MIGLGAYKIIYYLTTAVGDRPALSRRGYLAGGRIGGLTQRFPAVKTSAAPLVGRGKAWEGMP